ncbi:DNA (cytosine-5-)-methyltransferase [Ureibacillus sp. FSL K6-2830]|uniref:DNA (cytosine-5-)-methyltransferase n=1 Tax=Ureibacillus sp. FSL K6-2830 TaxID=2954610 RepID=UPI0030F53108
MDRIYKVGSLFAGIGGICLGFQQAKLDGIAGYELEWANEIDEYACETYRTNFSHKLIEGDINKVLNPELAEEGEARNKEYYQLMKQEILKSKIDVLTGGFPCQAFSIAGERRGFDDERGNLFWSIINLVEQLDKIHGMPRILFLENVKNLKSHDGGRTYKVIKSEIEKLGYIVKEHIINTMDYSYLPQNRERIYIICFLNKEDADKFTMFEDMEKFKLKQNAQDRKNEIKKIIDYTKKADDKYYYTKEKYPHYFLSVEEYESIPEQDRKSVRVNLDEQIDEMYQFYQVRRGMYVRKNKSDVCPTLTANMGTGGHNVPLIRDNWGIRKLTPAETLRLQGFPVGKGFKIPERYKGRAFADSYLYKQAGNAVSVPVIKLLATELLKVLIENDKIGIVEKTPCSNFL